MYTILYILKSLKLITISIFLAFHTIYISTLSTTTLHTPTELQDDRHDGLATRRSNGTSTLSPPTLHTPNVPQDDRHYDLATRRSNGTSLSPPTLHIPNELKDDRHCGLPTRRSNTI